MKKKVICENCKEETFLRSEPIYDGFEKVGDTYFCMLCGCKYVEDSLPEECVEEKNSFFSDDDIEEVPDPFADEKDTDSCRKCKNYIINAFQQKCGITQKNVLATDICFDFEEKKEDDSIEVVRAEDKKSEHELLEEAQWKGLFELGNGDVSMLMMFVQKLCAVFHVFDPANDLNVLRCEKWNDLQLLLKARVLHVIDWAEQVNLDSLDGIVTLKSIAEKFDNLEMDSLKDITEEIHQANHALIDQLEQKFLN
jgi:hypothetical protein